MKPVTGSVSLYSSDGSGVMADLQNWDEGSSESLSGGADAACLAQRSMVEPALSRLVQTIESEVIPRLLLAHGMQARPAAAPRSLPPTLQQAVDELAALSMTADRSTVCAYVDARRAEGLALDAVYLTLLAPTARRLGELWDADRVSFTDVTVGLWRLQQVLHELGAAALENIDETIRGRRALLAPMVGDQHTFGLAMVADFFRRAGWDVSELTTSSRAEFVDSIKSDWYDVVGVSLSDERRLDDLASLIRDLRRKSRNKAVAVLVGGTPFIGHPERVALVGADATATDGLQAAVQAGSLLAQTPAKR